MRWVAVIAALAATFFGLYLFFAVGNTVWASQDIERSHSVLLFLLPLLLIFPLVGFAMSTKKRR